jgi:dephospho-CoA kinase
LSILPKIIGLTGGIGSGKTTVANAFLWLGVPVFFADDEAKRCYTEDPLVKEEMIQQFGSTIYLPNGELNKLQLAQLIFTQNEARQFVEELVHPAVNRRFQKWIIKQNSPYVIREAAILFESGTHRDCYATISIEAPEEVRIERVVKRSGGQQSREEVKARMANQWTDEQRGELATYRWQNDNTQLLLPELMRFHDSLMGHHIKA